MIGLYPVTQNNLDDVLFMHASKNSNIAFVYFVEDQLDLFWMIGNFLSAKFSCLTLELGLRTSANGSPLQKKKRKKRKSFLQTPCKISF